MPDQNLKLAMAEINAVLRKYDIAADILLGSEHHIEFLRQFKTSWSCCWIEPGGQLRIRCKAADFPNPAAHRRALTATIGTLAGFADAARNESEQLTRVLRSLKINFEHMTKEETQ